MQAIKDVIEGVFQDLQSPAKSARRNLIEKWPAIVGPKLSQHTKPSLSQEGRLTVWVDESTLAFELKQRYEQMLLKRIQTTLGENEVKSLRVCVGEIR